MPLIVVKGSGPPLFSRDWLEKFRLDWGAIQKINTSVNTCYRSMLRSSARNWVQYRECRHVRKCRVLFPDFINQDVFHMP